MKTSELIEAEDIWEYINDEDFFTNVVPIKNLTERVEYVLREFKADMVENAPFFTHMVKIELAKIFVQNNIF